ncbi:Saccharopine dehydrogenase [Coniophora puteana RWD-64-598 SS2]|uniref:Saccharopine dehydrogenase n=1 Tax=Coniophora puteana (strain RWD-64-598) TaxID=741705 RepID=A0A5M3MBN5_CONPW|nr:Saccharopine dehydrogenase [Coniophora puteana RWD-64-598 SS2]EIW76045.1 Saccharopine dehydrogenase [Coniophora puteana RWD-64-598 SS2]
MHHSNRARGSLCSYRSRSLSTLNSSLTSQNESTLPSSDTAISGSSPPPATLPSHGISKKRVLVLGSGMMAETTIDELCLDTSVEVLLATRNITQGNKFVARHNHAHVKQVDCTNAQTVSELIAQADVVVSLLPSNLVPRIAEQCIASRISLVTPSYISQGLRSQDLQAVERDTLILAEVGFNPGYDHCAALARFDRLKQEGKRIHMYMSFCGSLPAPECANVPFGYKISHSPREMLLDTMAFSRFKLDSKQRQVWEYELTKRYFPKVDIMEGVSLEAFPNHDAVTYLKKFKWPVIRDMSTMMRGTLRYPGFSDLMQSFKAIGLLNTDTTINPSSWQDLTRHALQALLGAKLNNEPVSLRSAFGDVVADDAIDPLMRALAWLEAVPSSVGERGGPSLPAPPSGPASPLDHLAQLLSTKLAYGPNDRDMLVLHQEIGASPQNMIAPRIKPKNKREVSLFIGPESVVYRRQMVMYGTPGGPSALAKYTGVSLATAAKQVVHGKTTGLTGVVFPADESVWRPIVERMEEIGATWTETEIKGKSPIETRLFKELASKSILP